MPRLRKTPKLKFGPTTKKSGFTALNSALFSDLRPARIVRELIQNSLDAAVEAGEPTARVEFIIEPITDKDVPDLAEYKKHFVGAVKDARDSLSGNALQAVNDIRGALGRLASDDGDSCLFVMDNGVGLDEDRMTSLLGDGASAKSEGASGSYGVGHLASIPASDLRYALYGGVDKNGKRVASGYAMLASRSDPRGRHMFSGDGYLVDGFTNGAGGKLPYKFMSSRIIPNIIKARLDRIERDFGHGTVVAIPAFNYFGDDRRGRERESFRDVAFRVAAYNFSAAIQEGRLEVSVRNTENESESLNSTSLEEVLSKDKERSRSYRSGNFYEGLRPSGQNAYSVYLALSKGMRQTVSTDAGALEIRLLENPHSGNTRVDLFRNGMWITDDVPHLKRGDFANHQPFHAVLTLNAQDGGELHRLIRKAEGPMHDKLSLKLLDAQEKKRLTNALKQVADAIANIAPKVKTEEYTPDDYLVVSTGGGGESGGRREFAMWGAPVVIPRGGRSGRTRVGGGGGNGDGGNGGGNGDGGNGGGNGGGGNGGGNNGGGNGNGGGGGRRARSRRPLPFRATAVPLDVGRHVVDLTCDRALDEALLSLRIDENTDATCDRIWTDEEVSIKSCQIRAEGSGETVDGKLEDDGKTIRIRGLSANENYSVTVDYDAPDGFLDAVRAPVFRVDLSVPPPPPPPPRLRAKGRARRWRCELAPARPTRRPEAGGSRGPFSNRATRVSPKAFTPSAWSMRSRASLSS